MELPPVLQNDTYLGWSVVGTTVVAIILSILILSASDQVGVSSRSAIVYATNGTLFETFLASSFILKITEDNLAATQGSSSIDEEVHAVLPQVAYASYLMLQDNNYPLAEGTSTEAAQAYFQKFQTIAQNEIHSPDDLINKLQQGTTTNFLQNRYGDLKKSFNSAKESNDLLVRGLIISQLLNVVLLILYTRAVNLKLSKLKL